MRHTVCGLQADSYPFRIVWLAAQQWEANESKAFREHCPVMSIPIALKTFVRVALLFQPEEFCKLRVVAFHLVSSRIAMVYEVVRACATCCHIDKPAQGIL